MRRERRVVAAAVLGVQNEALVEHRRFEGGELAVVAQHVQDIFRGGKVCARLMNKQRRVRIIIAVRLLAVDGEKRELRDELKRLAQNILFRGIVRPRVIGVEGKHAAGEHIHHVARGRLHDDVALERGGQGAEIRQNFAEAVELASRGQVPEQQQVRRLLEGKAPPLRSRDQIAHVDAAVVQLALDGDFVSVFVLAERGDFGNFGEAAHHAVAVDVAQPPLYVVFFV